MNKVTISADKTTATVQGGADLGSVYYYAYTKANKGLNAGTCPPVGVSGLLLGGGYGYWSRANGLSCDKVLSFQMLLFNGTLLTVNSTSNADLFWASCGGGGGNFGIVVSWVIQLFDLPTNGLVQYGSLKLTTTDVATNVALWKFFNSWAPTADPQLGMELNIGGTNPAGRIFMYYLGTDSLSQIVASSGILNVSSTPLTQSYSKISYMKAVLQTTGWGLSQPTQLLSTNWDNYRYARSQESFYMLKPLSDSLMAGAYNLLLQNQNASIKVHPYGGVIAEKANTDTAFPWRNSLGLLQLAAGWAPGNATQEATALNWLNKMSPLLSAGMNQPRAAYINYMEEGLKNWQSAYYGANYKKLQQVKSKYDPLNFFKGVQSIDPAKAAPCKFQPCKLN